MPFFIIGGVFFGILFLGALVQSASGFGMAIVAMSILPFLVPVKTAVVGMLPASLVMFITILVKRRNFIQWKILLFLVPTLFIGRGIGTWALTVLPNRTMELIMGFLLILISLYYLFMKERIHLSENRAVGALAGFISGLSGGLANIGGPPLVLYLFTICRDKRVYQGTITAAFFISGLSSLLFHLFFGNFTAQRLLFGLFGIPGALLGTTLGLMVFHRTGRKFVSRMIVLLSALSGTALIML